MTVDEMLKVFAERAPSDQEFDGLSAKFADVEQAMNTTALRVAQRYWSGVMTYEQCDLIMNRMYAYAINRVVHRDEGLPDLLARVYEAFDAGEFFHADDSREIDPVAKYTRPSIERIIKEHGAV